MITLTRTQARRLRVVFRRTTLGIARRGPVPPLALDVADGRLRVRHRQAHLAVEHAAPTGQPASVAILLPPDALADFEGGNGSPVTLEAVGDGRTTARWADRGTAQAREYAVPQPGPDGTFPDPPDGWADPGPGFLDALALAAATAGEPGGRYDLGCLLLKVGPHGQEVVATDGRQALIQGGFRFPWEGDVLVRSSSLFACRGLPRDEPWIVGRAGGHVVLRSGPWTVALAVQADARFPRVDLAFPDPAAASARLRLDPAEARSLPEALGRLPGGDLDHAPVTLDLNGRVAVRARGDGGGLATELVLPRSSYAGAPVRVSTCRTFLGRAASLGFGEVEVTGAASPLVCRAGCRAYAWQPLDPDGVLAPREDDVRAEIGAAPSGGLTPATGLLPTAPPDRVAQATSARGCRSADPYPGSHEGEIEAVPADPVSEAEALHALLADAKARARRLVAALRGQRRRDRQVRATLDSLRQIRLPEASR